MSVNLKSFAPCLFALMIDAMGFGLVYPVLTALFMQAHSPMLAPGASLHLRDFYLGIGFLLYPVCMFFGAAFMSDLSDQYGRKRILSICMFGIGLSFALMGLGVIFSSLWLLFIGRGLSGFMAGSQPVAQASIGDMSTEANKARNMSFVTFTYCVGVVAGPVIGGLASDPSLFKGTGLDVPFFIAAILSFVAMIWLMLGMKETFVGRKQKRVSIFRPLLIFKDAIKHKGVRALGIVFFLYQIGWSIYFQYIVVHMRLTFHYLNWQLGLFNAMIGIGFGLGLLLVMPLILKCMKTKPMTQLMILILGVLLIISASLGGPDLQWPLAIVIGIVGIIAFTGMLTLFSDVVDAKRQGWSLGVANAMIALAWTITGFGSNLITLLSVQHLLAIGGVFILVAFFLLLIKISQ